MLIGIWTWDVLKDLIDWDEVVHVIFGLKPNTFHGRYCDFLILIDKQDRNRLNKEIANMIQSRSKLDTYFRLNDSEGKKSCINIQASPFYDASGKPIFVTGTICESGYEADFADNLRQFFALSVDLFCIANYDGFFVHLSDMWSEVLGYSTQELMQDPFMSFVHPKDKAKTLREFDLLKSKKFRTINFCNRYKAADGSYKTFLWNAVSIHKESKILAIARDISNFQMRINDVSCVNLNKGG